MTIISMLALINSADAQVPPPDFICIKSDTLFWSPVNNSCGPFQAYEIYVSPNQDGPFSLLATVTDSSQTSLFYINPTRDQFYFYLRTLRDCPGQISLSSDTLDNRNPQIPPVESVTVDGDNVIIKWTPSPSPEVAAYIIYRRTDIGTIPIDTVINGEQYVDTTAAPQSKSETYFIIAIDPCGNTSLFDLPHSTMLVNSSVSSCEQMISLDWNAYENWQNGIGRQEIWLSLDGTPPQPVDTVGPTDSDYDFRNADDGREYCFSIRAYEAGTNHESVSSTVCVQPDLVQPMRNLHIRNITYTQDDVLSISYVWDNNAEITGAELIAGMVGDDVMSTQTIPLTFPLNTFNDLTFDDSRIATHLWRFFIATTDQCDTVKESALAAPVFLTALSRPNRTNLLQWSPLTIEGADIVEYNIYKIVDGNALLLDVVADNIFEYTESVSIEDPGQASVCYYIEAVFDIDLPLSGAERLRSRSNTACAAQSATIYVPNAFAPRGINQEFKPVLVFGAAAEYKMQIFNRYGQMLFESTEPARGWRGKYEGRDVPQGVYTYSIRVKQPDGKLIERAGWLMLVR